MTIFLLVAVIVGLAVAATFMARWVDNDGGPRRPRKPRAKDSWSTDRPTRPYATLNTRVTESRAPLDPQYGRLIPTGKRANGDVRADPWWRGCGLVLAPGGGRPAAARA